MTPAERITCPVPEGRGKLPCGSGASFMAENVTHWLYRCSRGHIVKVPKPFAAVVEPEAWRERGEAAAGERAKREGMERADDAAPEEWKSAAWEALRTAAKRHKEFTTDIVTLLIPRELRDVREPRALGAIMSRGAAEGLIEDTGRTEKSSLKSAHRRPKTLWRSLIYTRPTF